MVEGVVAVALVDNGAVSEVEERYFGGILGSVFWNWKIGVVAASWAVAWWSFARNGRRNIGGVREVELCFKGIFNALWTRVRDETWCDRVCC